MLDDRVLHLLSRWRVEVATVAAVPALALAHPSHGAIVAYLPVLMAGLALRTWARGHFVRERLATTGPYALVRHPLYIGSFLMGLAVALMTRRPMLPPAFAGAFVAMYWPKAVREETWQRSRWGADWDRYAGAVEPLVPRRLGGGRAAGAGPRFSWSRVVRNGEWQTWLGAAAALAALWLLTP